MNHSNNSTFLEDWKKIARLDWQRIKRNIRENDAVAAGFFLQQSLEKFMKSFLLSHDWKLKKIHKLDTLLDEAIKYNPQLELFYIRGDYNDSNSIVKISGCYSTKDKKRT